MPLSTGSRLGPYEIVASLGAGGMGEVYKARDTRLEREVALKVLPAFMTGDAAGGARLVREAQTASRLNHPNIVTVYDVGESSGRVFIAMECVTGRPLQAMIPPGGLSLDEALKYATPIAAALAVAHDAGIVHRDLKPANIMVTSDGVVKVLDFGLALIVPAPESLGDANLIPTISASGMILGTPCYMAPEQAQGKRVDKRADIWAFGLVLYEMLTGDRPFKGATAAETMAAVLTAEPHWETIPKRAQRLLRRCLEKDPQRRLRDIGDVWDLLEPDLEPGAVPPMERPAAARKWVIASFLLAIAAIAGFWTAWRAGSAGAARAHPLTRLSVDLGLDAMTGVSFTALISPDGRRLVFPARGLDGKPQLATRLLDQDQPTLLPGTENGVDPFFSPDGEWIGFFSARQMKKTSVHGGAPVTLCAVGEGRGASWGEDGYIIAATDSLAPLVRIPEAGGNPQPITRLAMGEGSHRWPQVLAGGRVLFISTAFNIGSGNASIEVLTLKTGTVKILPQTGYGARYLPSGHLVYVHDGILYGVRFDLDTLDTRGTPTPLIEDLSANPMTGGSQFSISGPASDPSVLVYLPGKGPVVQWQLMWLESSGKMQSLNAEPGVLTNPRISPDGRKLAFLNGTDIHIRDLERETTTRLVSGQVTLPIWAPDSQHIVYLSVSGGHNFYWIRSDGAGEPVRIFSSQTFAAPWSISPDGHQLAFYMKSPGTADDVWTLPLDLTDPDHPKPGKPELFLATPHYEGAPRFSPDGHWLAYGADEAGRQEIYVRPFPAGKGQWKISSAGGSNPIWSNNGRELFYRAADNRIMVVDYRVSGTSFFPGKPRAWTEKPILFAAGMPNLDLAPDGKRFVVFAPMQSNPERVRVTMLFNFLDELRRRVPMKN